MWMGDRSVVVDALLRVLRLKYSLPGVKRRSSVSLQALPRDHTGIGMHKAEHGLPLSRYVLCFVWTRTSCCLLAVLLLSSHFSCSSIYSHSLISTPLCKRRRKWQGKTGSSAWLREERTEFAGLLCVPIFVKKATGTQRGEVICHSCIAGCGECLLPFLCTEVRPLCWKHAASVR